jgi:hypothetical protein
MRLYRWHEALVDAEKGYERQGIDALFDDWHVQNEHHAWMLYTLWETGDRKHLFDAGGYLDQDEGLLSDVATLAQMSALVRAEVRRNKPDG